MLNLIRSWFKTAVPNGNEASPVLDNPDGPALVMAKNSPDFVLANQLFFHETYPLLNWDAAQLWIDQIDSEAEQANAWQALEKAWLQHFRAALGGHFNLHENDSALLVSSLDPATAQATLNHMTRSVQQVLAILPDLAQAPVWGKDILIVFDDEDSYYRYVSYYYPEAGEFAFSGGMCINQGCVHYVAKATDLHAINAVIAHEITHGCLGHLALPLWLEEGLTVNTEQRIAGVPYSLHPPLQLRRMHLRFWNATTIQEFWSGASFERTDDGNLLSYDLARILVAQFAKNWPSFAAFVKAAEVSDGGAAAARSHLQIELGHLACVLLEQEPNPTWEPAVATATAT